MRYRFQTLRKKIHRLEIRKDIRNYLRRPLLMEILYRLLICSFPKLPNFTSAKNQRNNRRSNRDTFLYFLYTVLELLEQEVQSWTKVWGQSHELKQIRFFYGLFHDCFFATFYQKRQNLAYGWTGGYLPSNPRIFLKFPTFLRS